MSSSLSPVSSGAGAVLSPSRSHSNGQQPAPSPAKPTPPRSVRFDSPQPQPDDDDDDAPENDEAQLGEGSMDVQSGDDSGRILDRGRSREPSEAVEEDGVRVPLHVEVRLLATSTIRYDLIRRMLHTHLDATFDEVVALQELDDWREVLSLRQNVERVWVAECALTTPTIPLSLVSVQLHIYQPSPTASTSLLTTSDEDEDAGVSAATIAVLPSTELEGVWDSLVFEGEVKERLLGYIYSTILFGDAAVDFNIVTWNRVVLLHGPPGTGKTSLCRALAQKLSIRLSDRYDRGQLVEINSHSLFSKWFSESGKLVQKLFASITEMVDDEGCFVVVLIDEVESLTAARAGAMSGKEPSDALRVVNALLTQLDKLKHRKNCLVMTTSNLSGAIDVAFIDRADIKQYIGLPPAQAVYWILQSCLKEIMRAGLIPPVILHDWQAVELFRSTSSAGTDRHRRCSDLLYNLAQLCHEHTMSGRTLRRLPVLAHARFIGMTLAGTGGPPAMEVWLAAMSRCVVEEGRQMELVGAV